MKPFFTNNSQGRQSLLGAIVSNGQYKSSLALRIRRNKWSIIKLILLGAVSIYLLLYLKSMIFDTNYSTNIKIAQDPFVRSQSDNNHRNPQHAKLVNPTEREQENNFQVSPEPLQKQQNNDIDQQHSSPNVRDDQSSQMPLPSLHKSRTKQKKKLLARKRKKKPITDMVDSAIRKRKLDEQLKKLMPIVPDWGANGKGVHLTSAEEKEEAAKVFKQGAYNVYISDRISPNRTLRSVVAKECNHIEYNVDDLPNVSVIIIFTNEIFSALVRTVWSVINRTPKNLLKEIILVDDFSDKDYLKGTLKDYLDIYWNTIPGYEDEKDPEHKLVSLIHLPSRLGLIKARLEGARAAKGDVLLFLDSHCEVTDRWLEPLVQRIKEDRRVFICPVIDIINDKTLEYNAVDPYFFQLGGFDWAGQFNWINRRESEAQNEPTKATKSPTMAGGLFAVDRRYFFEVGSYDEDMQIWGGENLELSFRVWQCGGRIEIHPCSHVGHIFRDFHPYSFNGIDSHGFNTLRTVLVWMDEYSKYFFMSRPDLLHMKAGNLTSRLDLRTRLNCSSFGWYLDNIYEKRKFIYDRNVLAYGWLRNEDSGLCVDVLNKHETHGETAGLYTCETMVHPLNVTTNQLFSYSKEREIRREEGCLTIEAHSSSSGSGDDDDDDDDTKSNGDDDRITATTTTNHARGPKKFSKIILKACEEPEYVSSSGRKKSLRKHKRQKWRHQLVNPRSNRRLLVSEASGECLTTEHGQSFSDLLATTCDSNDPSQYWEFQNYARNYNT